MLACFIAALLCLIAVFFAEAGGEMRYEKPWGYPTNQRIGRAFAMVFCAAAICCARYL